MAKKQGSNIFTAYIEKVALAVGVVVFGWVVFTRFVRPPGVELSDGVYTASQAANKALDLAESIKDRMKVSSDKSVKRYVAQVEKFGITNSFELGEVDTFPLTPIYLVNMEIEEQRLYTVPDIPKLQNPQVDLFHGRAWVSVSDSQPQNQRQNPETEIGDVDFVTVEAVIPFAEIRESFKKHFAGSQVEKPLEWPDPIIAEVRLERSRLLGDRWGEWEKVERLNVDDLKGKDLPNDMTGMSHASYAVLMESSREPYYQKLILQPLPFELVDGGEWLPPTEKIELAKEKKKQQKGRRTTATTQRRPTQRRQKNFAPQGGGAMPGMMPGMMPGAMPGMMPQQGRRRGGRAATRRNQPQDTSAMEEWLGKKEITLWAHDDHVEPGGIYRYQIRVGFFNPIATHNWFTPQQQHLKSQMILWSPPVSPEKVVVVPERTLFFPRIAGSAQDRTVEIEVCRWQDGLWHKKRFRHLTAGSEIGRLEKAIPLEEKDRNTRSDDQQEVDVDYSTSVTILDILPDSQHWCKVGRSVRPVATTDILYLDTDGQTRRIGVDKRTWPDGLRKKQTAINKIIRKQSKPVSVNR